MLNFISTLSICAYVFTDMYFNVGNKSYNILYSAWFSLSYRFPERGGGTSGENLNTSLTVSEITAIVKVCAGDILLIAGWCAQYENFLTNHNTSFRRTTLLHFAILSKHRWSHIPRTLHDNDMLVQ